MSIEQDDEIAELNDHVAKAEARIRELETAQTNREKVHAQQVTELIEEREELALRISRAREILKGITYNTMPIVVREALAALEGK